MDDAPSTEGRSSDAAGHISTSSKSESKRGATPKKLETVSDDSKYSGLLTDFKKLSRLNLQLEEKVQSLTNENETLRQALQDSNKQVHLMQQQMIILNDKYTRARQTSTGVPGEHTLLET